MKNKYKCCLGLCFYLFLFPILPCLADGTTTSNQNDSSSPTQINQQSGVINNNGFIGQPINCGRSCLYLYSDFSRNDSRLGIGVNLSIDSVEDRLINAQVRRTVYEVESGYIKAITEACHAKNILAAELNAKALARIWNVEYKSLLHPSCIP